MKDNLIEEATEMIKQACLVDDWALFPDALNKISQQISSALKPLNQVNLPFVAAVLARYVNALKSDLSTEQQEVFEATIDLLKGQIKEYKVWYPATKENK